MRARLDFGDWRAGRRDPLVPPRRLGLPSQVVGVGERVAGIMVEWAGLHPGSAVLDMGCGPGRTAAALTRHLDATGRYEGFDVMPKAIGWCEKAITPRFPNFRFQVADIHNGQYNPAGSQRAAEYVFPYGDGTFDVAVAVSLFTHLRPFEGERYLAEAGRTLRPGGRLVATWYLLNDDAEQALAAGSVLRPGLFTEGRPPMRLEHHLTDEGGNPFRSYDPETPEYMIAVDENLVRTQYERAGLRIVEVIYGRWVGREGAELLGQDVVIAERQ
jgi:SAM-dependent methyltransferase